MVGAQGNRTDYRSQRALLKLLAHGVLGYKIRARQESMRLLWNIATWSPISVVYPE